jgi:hypothetical protein
MDSVTDVATKTSLIIVVLMLLLLVGGAWVVVHLTGAAVRKMKLG